MKVNVTFFGPLAEQAGEETVQFDLPEGASYGDLLDGIGHRFGDRFHERIWDREVNSFKPGVLTIGAGRDLGSRNIPLTDGEEIKIVPLLGGG
jgi:molybdopterin converting factor small subunit